MRTARAHREQPYNGDQTSENVITGSRKRLAIGVTDPFSVVTLLRGQMRFFKEQGYDVFLICAPAQSAADAAEAEGAVYLPLVMQREIAPWRDLVALVRAVRLLRSIRPDVLNAGTPKASFILTVAGFLCRVPCRIYTLRGLRYSTALKLKRAMMMFAERITARLAHHVVCVSHSVREQAVRDGVLDESKAVVLGAGGSNGIDLGRFMVTARAAQTAAEVRRSIGATSDDVVIGFVGRLTRDKGVAELAEAWASLRTTRDNVHLLIVGFHEPGDAVPDSVAALLRDDPRVHVSGLVPDPAPYYLAMDVVALPSHREGFPNVVLEAGAMKRPVVACKVTGCVDAVLDGATGTLVEPRASDQLATALANYIDSDLLRQQHGEAAHEFVRANYSNAAVWDALSKAMTAWMAMTPVEVLPMAAARTGT